jgi:hypothetical protein
MIYHNLPNEKYIQVCPNELLLSIQFEAVLALIILKTLKASKNTYATGKGNVKETRRS